jgi:integrase
MTATFVQQVEDYIALRRGLGARLHKQALSLLDFGRYLDRMGHCGPITTQLALRWAQAPRSKDPAQTARRLGVIRNFLRHRAGFDPATEVPPPQLLGSGIRRNPPHVYSPLEVQTLLEACSRLSPRKGLRPRTCRTLFALLFATGLRVSEALGLDDADVDLVDGVLTVRHGKLGKRRLVPLHSTALVPLRRYVLDRDRIVPSSPAFFRTEHHARLLYTVVLMTFDVLRKRLGWTAEGRTRRPRLHDARHTFAVGCLVRWYQEGIHPERRIAHLATYLGHVTVRDTYWYLSAVPELSALASDRFELFAEGAREDLP